MELKHVDPQHFKKECDAFAALLGQHDLEKAKELDLVMIDEVGTDGRCMCMGTDVPPRLLIYYSFNRAALRLSLDRIEEAGLCMIDVMESLHFYNLEGDFYFLLWLLAEELGHYDQFSQAISYANDKFMMAIICQLKFPALSLSLFWEAEHLYTELGRLNAAVFVKNIRQAQYGVIAERYYEIDPVGCGLFSKKVESIGEVYARIPAPDEPKYVPKEPERQLSEAERELIYGEMNEHHPSHKEWRLLTKSYPEFSDNDSILLKLYGHQSLEDKTELPNLLEVLEAVSYDEEKYALIYDEGPFGRTMPMHEDWYDIDQLQNNDGELVYYPRCHVKNRYYRGQTTFYRNCQPSLRRPGMDKYKVFVERLKTCELSSSLRFYPSVQQFHCGMITTFHSGKVSRDPMKVDDMALAQHYGIATEYLDLTTDKWVAAYFACTDGEEIYKQDNTDSTGVFYIYHNHTPLSYKFHPVGIQPALRPVMQLGYVLEMGRCQNFNKMAQGILFRHDTSCSMIIHKLFNESKLIYPHDVLGKKAKAIVEASQFSESALEDARLRFYPSLSDTAFDELLKGSGVTIVKNNDVPLSQDEVESVKEEFSLIDKYLSLNTARREFMESKCDES